MKKKEENYSPYCKLCESCGENGCCSWLNCFAKNIENQKGNYCKTYLADARFDNKLANLGAEIFDRLEEGIYTSEQAVSEYKKEWDKIWESIYK